MRSDEVVVAVRDLRMRYGDTDVLDGVDLQVHRGEVLALLGPNGAGKSTTIEILEGFRQRSDGFVEVLGEDPERAPEAWRARIGVVLQSWRDHGRWRVRDLLRHLGDYHAPYGTPGRPRPRPVDELLAVVGLASAADQRVNTLSGGQRRRLDVAMGIVGRPELLFLDEPTAGLDPAARREFHDLVHGLADQEDATVLLTTHDLAEAERLADRILVLAAGRIVAAGSAEELARQVTGVTEVRWTVDGVRHVHGAADATAFVRDLVAEHGAALRDLEVRPTTLEETYMEIVRRHEAGAGAGAGSPGAPWPEAAGPGRATSGPTGAASADGLGTGARLGEVR